jgi:hypothetical protein
LFEKQTFWRQELKNLISTLSKQELRDRIYAILSAQEAEAAALKEPWEPVFDSLATVELLCSVAELLPQEIAASKIVRAGGYSTSSEAAADITERIAAVYGMQQSTCSVSPKSTAEHPLQVSNK